MRLRVGPFDTALHVLSVPEDVHAYCAAFVAQARTQLEAGGGRG
jgi:hypothetical protein